MDQKKREEIKLKASREIKQIKEYWKKDYPPLIADLGANLGYYTRFFLENFPNSKVHAYEPVPKNIKNIKTLTSSNLSIHEYGLFNETKTDKIGLPTQGRSNIGCYSLFHTGEQIEIELKRADEEEIRPDIVKMDVEGCEPQILECKDFFKNTYLIHVEMLYLDDFGINKSIIKNLESLGFKYVKHTSKNNQIWVREK